ncbi:armadillo-like helical domain-containing protein, partial [Tanacetum coccineum]
CSKFRYDALIGIRDIFLKHPAELKMHRLSVIEKLRERMGDEDKIVRETLYQLLKAVIFPECKEENQGTFISLMMAYVFNAMTHLSIDVRLMAFKFFDLVVQHYPVSFSMYAEKDARKRRRDAVSRTRNVSETGNAGKRRETPRKRPREKWKRFFTWGTPILI